MSNSATPTRMRSSWAILAVVLLSSQTKISHVINDIIISDKD